MLLLLKGIREANANPRELLVGEEEQLESVYPHAKIRPLLKRLACRAEIVFYELIAGATMDDFSAHLGVRHRSTLSVVNPIMALEGCQILVGELLTYVFNV